MTDLLTNDIIYNLVICELLFKLLNWKPNSHGLPAWYVVRVVGPLSFRRGPMAFCLSEIRQKWLLCFPGGGIRGGQGKSKVFGDILGWVCFGMTNIKAGGGAEFVSYNCY